MTQTELEIKMIYHSKTDRGWQADRAFTNDTLLGALDEMVQLNLDIPNKFSGSGVKVTLVSLVPLIGKSLCLTKKRKVLGQGVPSLSLIGAA